MPSGFLVGLAAQPLAIQTVFDFNGTTTPGSALEGTDGTVQHFTVPAGITTLRVETWGAQGGGASASDSGLGGYCAADLTVTPGETLDIYCGGKGRNVSPGAGPLVPGGYNGGGGAYRDASAGGSGYSGGGASDVRRSSSFVDNFNRADSPNSLGAGWTVNRQAAGSELGISSNKAYCSSSSGGAVAALHDATGIDLLDVTVTLGRASTAGGSFLYLGTGLTYNATTGIGFLYDSSAAFSHVQRMDTVANLALTGGRGTFLAFTGSTSVFRITYRKSTGAGSIWQDGVLVGNFTGPTSADNYVGFQTNSASAGDTWDDFTLSNSTKLIIAGGGGGGPGQGSGDSPTQFNYGGAGGDGGGSVGEDGQPGGNAQLSGGGKGGSQTAGGVAGTLTTGFWPSQAATAAPLAGSLGQGGDGSNEGNSTYNGCGGGGGYYGGGGSYGGTGNATSSGAGGGSNYCSVTPLRNLRGLRTGHGRVRVSYSGVNPALPVAPTNASPNIAIFTPKVPSVAGAGSPYDFVVPAGVTSLTIEAWGGSGGVYSLGTGKGGHVKCTVVVTPGERLAVYSAKAGQTRGYYSDGVPAKGGFPGGGDGLNVGGQGGGGWSGVIRSDGTPLAIAGGGGGDGGGGPSQSGGGVGGGTTGGSGSGGTTSTDNGAGGTQSAGGAPGAGGNGVAGSAYQGGRGASGTSNLYADGGGGGGYYGGGGGTGLYGNSGAGAGGGGSSFVSGTVAVNDQGVNYGDGLVVLSWGSPTYYVDPLEGAAATIHRQRLGHSHQGWSGSLQPRWPVATAGVGGVPTVRTSDGA
jgi:hypothetical protein